uniref:Uncharacterized protein n=1 Tax=Oryzias melastigma TaxID=30732 RepID=A0A3B3B3C6_ORYME
MNKNRNVTRPASRLLALSLLTWDSAMSAQLYDGSYPGLQFLELLLSTLHSQVLSFIQTVLQVLHSDLQVLLHPLQMSAGSIVKVQLGILMTIMKGIISAPDLSIKSALHGFNHPLAVPLDLFYLLVLLCQLPVNLTFDLVELKLNSENLGLLVLQSALEIIEVPVN